jgi:predicted transcriptional regulator
MTVKDDLHHLVDELPEGKLAETMFLIVDEAHRMDPAMVDELLEYAQWLAADEDEPLSEDELARVREGEAAIAAGDYVTLEELHRRRGE